MSEFQNESYIVHGDDDATWLSINIMDKTAEFDFCMFRGHQVTDGVRCVTRTKWDLLAICDAFAQLKERINEDG